MSQGPEFIEEIDNFYTVVPDQGLCLIDDVIINLRKAGVIRKLEGKTLVYLSGNEDPIILPSGMFDRLKEAVFAVDEFDDEDDDLDEDD